MSLVETTHYPGAEMVLAQLSFVGVSAILNTYGVGRSLASVAWLAYRRIRYWLFTLAGRNPLSSGRAAVSYAKDRQVVRVLSEIRNSPPTKLQHDSEGRTLWQTSVGRFWTPPGAEQHYVQLIETETRSDVYNLADSIVGPGSIVLDCGANVGFITRQAIEKGAALVVCFEPSPGTAVCLRKNFADEIAAGRVCVVEKGLWDKDDTLFLKTGRVANPASHSLGQAEGATGVYVPVTTIDRVVEQLNLPRVDVIKMDIEGAEVNALKGATETIRKFRPRIGIGTEHTSDLIANNEAVIDTILKLDDSYQYVCTETHPYRSPSKGLVLTPHTLFFSSTKTV